MPKLPFWKTINSSYAFVFCDLKRYFSASWKFMAIAISGTFATILFLGYSDNLLIIGLWVSIFIGVWVSYVVGWHRAILLDEKAGRLVFGGREMRFLGFSILISLAIVLSILFFFLISLLFSMVPILGGVFSSIGIIVLFTAIIFINRFLLVLPAIAIGNREVTFKKSWQITAGNTWRIFGGILVCSLPIAIVNGILTSLVEIAAEGDSLMWTAGFVMETMGMVLIFVEAALYAGFLSFAYRFFVEDAGATPQTAAA